MTLVGAVQDKPSMARIRGIRNQCFSLPFFAFLRVLSG
jgi:hypothetical protein